VNHLLDHNPIFLNLDTMISLMSLYPIQITSF